MDGLPFAFFAVNNDRDNPSIIQEHLFAPICRGFTGFMQTLEIEKLFDLVGSDELGQMKGEISPLR